MSEKAKAGQVRPAFRNHAACTAFFLTADYEALTFHACHRERRDITWSILSAC
jgi:hypothetical protein